MYKVVIGDHTADQKVQVFSANGDTSEPVFSVFIMESGFHMGHKSIPSDIDLAKAYFNACINAIDKAKDIASAQKYENTYGHFAGK